VCRLGCVEFTYTSVSERYAVRGPECQRDLDVARPAVDSQAIVHPWGNLRVHLQSYDFYSVSERGYKMCVLRWDTFLQEWAPRPIF
jgi:hypothetical protein